MQLTAVLLLAVSLQVAASGHAQTVTLSVKNVSLEKVFTAVKQQTGYTFFYDDAFLRGSKSVTVHAVNQPLSQLLSQIFRNQPLDFAFENKAVIISRKKTPPGTSLPDESQKSADRLPAEIHGRVADSSGNPISDVSVVVLNKHRGTQTDRKGVFTIGDVSATDTLVFSRVGYLSKTVVVGSQSDLVVVLMENKKNLGDVIVVGYATQNKSSFTGAVSSVPGKDFQDIPVSTISNALAGRLPGLMVVNQSGLPGTTAGMTIRGTGTFNNSSPLYVIDGVIRDQISMDGMDPNEISAVTVLKDAVSAAVYGARAANGVILVTTKRGAARAPEIDYKINYGTKSPSRQVKTMNAYQDALFTNDMIYNTDGHNLAVAQADLQYFTPDEVDYFKTHSYNWLDLAWKNPGTIQHSLTLNGGSDKINYFMSAGYYKERGGFSNTDYNRINIRSNVDAKVSKNLSATLMVDGNIRHSQRPYDVYDNVNEPDGVVATYNGLLGSTVFSPPYIDGKPISPSIGVPWNPLAMLNEAGYNHTNTRSENAQLTLTYKVPFVPGLSFKGSYSYNVLDQVNKYFNTAYTLYNFAGTGGHNHILTDSIIGSTSVAQNTSDRVGTSYYEGQTTQLDLYATYENFFGRHHVDGVLVYEQAEGSTNTFGGYRDGLLTNTIDQLFVGSQDPSTFSGGETESGRLSYLGRLNYDFAGKYILQTSFRYDGSYIFPPDRRWGFFPSAGAAWVISEEPFFRDNVSLINKLKLKGSVGLLGNDAVNPFQYESAFSVGAGPYFGGRTSAIATGVYPNADITWEKTRMTNIGLEGQLFSGKVSVEFDYFWKHTYDMLFTRNNTIPGTFGIALPSQNYGVVDVHGYEVSADYHGSAGAFHYHLGGNISYSKDNVTYIDVAPGTPSYLSPLGHPIATLQAYVSTGIIRNQHDLDTKYVLQGYPKQLGALGYADLHGPNGAGPDGIVNANDKAIISDNAVPRYSYGLNLGGSWKNFSLELFFQGMGAWNKLLSDNGSSSVGGYDFWTNHYSETNPNGKYPAPISSDANSQTPSTFWMINASFIRLKSANISYNFPHNLLTRAGVHNLRLFLNGDNLFLLMTKQKYIDPEAYGLGGYPVMRDLSAGIDLTF